MLLLHPFFNFKSLQAGEFFTFLTSCLFNGLKLQFFQFVHSFDLNQINIKEKISLSETGRIPTKKPESLDSGFNGFT